MSKAVAKIDEVLAQAMTDHQQGKVREAEAGYYRVLNKQPDHPDALQLVGVIAHQKGDHQAAIDSIRKSLKLKPEQPTAWNNIGNIYAATGKTKMAVDCYRSAIRLAPDYTDAHRNLANVLYADGDTNEAAEHYRRAIETSPKDVASHICLADILEKQGHLEDAAEAFRQASVQSSNSPVVFSRLGRVLRKLNRMEEARAAHQRWLQLEPDNPVAQHLFAACQTDAAPDRASNGYVKTTFDRFAETFDKSLESLDYRVPRLIEAALEKHAHQPGRAEMNVVDLGCGTGLCAQYLRGLAKQLDGVDLSPKMLAKAAQRKVYDHLIEAELTEFLERQHGNYDLIISADTLVYVGNLRPVLAAAVGALRNDGLLVFTVETLPEPSSTPGYQLNRYGRYAHAKDYLKNSLEEAGLEILEWTEAVLRVEADERVGGVIIVAHK